MKFKFQVVEYVELPKEKGFVINFQTQYGERVGTYIRSRTDFDRAKNLYPLKSVHLLDLRASVAGDRSAALTIELPTEVAEKELF